MALSKLLTEQLAREALAARRKAYAPYSRFKVGAALLLDSAPQRVITGCNIENASYGLAICAERAAIAHAVGEGLRNFRAIAVASGSENPAPPCGMCLQVMVEFCGDLEIVLVNTAGLRQRTRLKRLMTQPFRWKGHPGS